MINTSQHIQERHFVKNTLARDISVTYDEKTKEFLIVITDDRQKFVPVRIDAFDEDQNQYLLNLLDGINTSDETTDIILGNHKILMSRATIEQFWANIISASICRDELDQPRHDNYH